MGLAFTPITVFAGLWGIPYAMQTFQLDKLSAASAVSFSFFGFVIGGMAIDPISKHIKAKRTVLLLGGVLSLSFLILIIYLPHLSLIKLTILCFVFGFFSSLYLVGYALAKELNPKQEMSSVISLST